MYIIHVYLYIYVSHKSNIYTPSSNIHMGASQNRGTQTWLVYFLEHLFEWMGVALFEWTPAEDTRHQGLEQLIKYYRSSAEGWCPLLG